MEIAPKGIKCEKFLKGLYKLAETHGVTEHIKVKEQVRPKSLSLLVENTTESEANLLDGLVKFPTTFKKR